MFLFDRIRSLQKRTNSVVDGAHLGNIQKLIGLSDISGGIYYISATNCETYCSLIIHYNHTQNYFDLMKYRIKQLPHEINALISHYLPSTIMLHIHIHFTNGYPFDPPRWSLISCDDRLASSLKNAKEYYEYIIQNHNDSNLYNWSPATNIDSDILTFMLRIHPFDNLFC